MKSFDRAFCGLKLMVEKLGYCWIQTIKIKFLSKQMGGCIYKLEYHYNLQSNIPSLPDQLKCQLDVQNLQYKNFYVKKGFRIDVSKLIKLKMNKNFEMNEHFQRKFPRMLNAILLLDLNEFLF